jgi:hypothetical protein
MTFHLIGFRKGEEIAETKVLLINNKVSSREKASKQTVAVVSATGRVNALGNFWVAPIRPD